MEIVVRHKHGRVPQALRTVADEKVGRVARFLRDVKRIDVEFDDERNPRVAESDLCEILVHVKGTLLKAHSAAGTPEAALDLAIDKMEHQARKLHERRVTRSHPKRSRRPEQFGAAPNGSAGEPTDAGFADAGLADTLLDDPVRDSSAEDSVSDGSASDGLVSGDESSTQGHEGGAVDEAQIVRVKQFMMKPMSPREAALQMDLLGHDFFLFTSSEHGRAAVIYRRRDGDLGLIEAG